MNLHSLFHIQQSIFQYKSHNEGLIFFSPACPGSSSSSSHSSSICYEEPHLSFWESNDPWHDGKQIRLRRHQISLHAARRYYIDGTTTGGTLASWKQGISGSMRWLLMFSTINSSTRDWWMESPFWCQKNWKRPPFSLSLNNYLEERSEKTIFDFYHRVLFDF